MSLWIAEDDFTLGQHLATKASEMGFSTQILSRYEDLEQALENSNGPDLLILDRLLGHLDTKSSFTEDEREMDEYRDFGAVRNQRTEPPL